MLAQVHLRANADLLVIGARVVGTRAVNLKTQCKFLLEQPRFLEVQHHLVRQRADLEPQPELLSGALEEGVPVEQVEVGLAEFGKEGRALERAVAGAEAEIPGSRLLE